jgi:hypothetical protein
MSKIDELSDRISNCPDFQKFRQVSTVKQETDFVIVSDYQGQSYIGTSTIDNGTLLIEFKGTPTIIQRDDSKLFLVKNVTECMFIPVDGKYGLLGFGDSYCDAIIFDNQDFCFIEFKLNATSMNKVIKNRIKAISQLANTIAFFDTKLLQNYQGLSLEAYVCTPETYPRNDASWKELSINFLEEYGIPLFEMNEKTCR